MYIVESGLRKRAHRERKHRSLSVVYKQQVYRWGARVCLFSRCRSLPKKLHYIYTHTYSQCLNIYISYRKRAKSKTRDRKRVKKKKMQSKLYHKKLNNKASRLVHWASQFVSPNFLMQCQCASWESSTLALAKRESFWSRWEAIGGMSECGIFTVYLFLSLSLSPWMSLTAITIHPVKRQRIIE